MSDHLESIAQWIENRAIGFTIGVNLFVGHIPPERSDNTPPPDRCVVLLENVPGAPVFDLPDRLDKPVQVLSRAVNFVDAKADNFTIYRELHGNEGLDLPPWEAASGRDYVAMTIEANASPASIGQDNAHRWQFSCNYVVRIRE